jgi:hypothetical protein
LAEHAAVDINASPKFCIGSNRRNLAWLRAGLAFLLSVEVRIAEAD